MPRCGWRNIEFITVHGLNKGHIDGSVTPLLTHCSYCSFALIHRYNTFKMQEVYNITKEHHGNSHTYIITIYIIFTAIFKVTTSAVDGEVHQQMSTWVGRLQPAACWSRHCSNCEWGGSAASASNPGKKKYVKVTKNIDYFTVPLYSPNSMQFSCF